MAERDLFHPADAEQFFSKSAGKLYQPSNGTEGDKFYGLWCADCKRDADFRRDPDFGEGCAILALTMALGTNDPSYPKQWIYGHDGQPKCTAHDPLNGDAP